ncbi:MAG: hypothetical protein SF339_16070 [Blastocatellia bacterium]|nr:hypothetical protein [Blastocatellia bacterium]
MSFWKSLYSRAGRSLRILALLPLLAMAALPFSAHGQTVQLEASSEYSRPDPFGNIVEADRSKGENRDAKDSPGLLRAARNGYASFHLTAKLPAGGPYSLSVSFQKPAGLQIDLLKAWYHLHQKSRTYYPDALIPVLNPFQASLPDAENRIPGQTSQAFWVDVFIPRDTPPGRYDGEATLQSGSRRASMKIQLEVLQAAIPEDDPVIVDHNSYGTSWLAQLYPKLSRAQGDGFFRSDALFSLIHAYHRLFYEHRGAFHQLGYGHAGKVGPEFAPALAGVGREKKITSWELYDRHYGPLLDGSAFARTRRGARPIPFVYLPINPEWPASFLAWGEPGYEAEFVNVVGEMERHFRAKGWTRTRFEMFFNHKKRYKGFHWDGDEARFSKDDAPAREFDRLLKKAVPRDSPVQFVHRLDASWRLEDQFKSLAGVVNFWICSTTILSWLPEPLQAVRQRGDIVWTYAGPPAIDEASSAILENPLRAWMWSADGYVHWLTVSPSTDPWFASEGETTCLAYPGERFGIDGPIPSIRLKIQRNFLQDLSLMRALEKTHAPDLLRREVSRRVNGTAPADWWNPRPALANLPPEDWTNPAIDRAVAATQHRYQNWSPRYWQPIRQYILNLAEGGQPQ